MREATALQSPQSTALSEGSHPSTEARLAALVGGAALITIAVRDRSWRGVGLALAGAPLVWRGATGMRHLDSVQKIDDRRSHWIGKSPVGRVEWDAEIVSEREGHSIAWRSLPGSRVHNAGTVSFEDATGGRGTVVRVEMEASPGNGLGRAASRTSPSPNRPGWPPPRPRSLRASPPAPWSWSTASSPVPPRTAKARNRSPAGSTPRSGSPRSSPACRTRRRWRTTSCGGGPTEEPSPPNPSPGEGVWGGGRGGLRG